MNYKISNLKTGFTIIELIISIFILSIAIVGVFSAFSVLVILTADSADRLTATYLSQEGIEIIRNIRDQNWLDMNTCSTLQPGESTPGGILCTPTWVSNLGVNDSPRCDLGCEVDYTTGTNNILIRQWSDNGIYLDMDSNNFYTYTPTNTPYVTTKFKRKIIITPIADANDSSTYHIIKIKSEVSWDKKATILNSRILAGSPNPYDLTKCNPSNCIIAEETLYNWYNPPTIDFQFDSFGFGSPDEIDDIGFDTINVTVPHDTDVTHLIAIFGINRIGSLVTVNGEVQTNNQTPNDFTNPLIYIITATDGTTKQYTVTVTINQ